MFPFAEESQVCQGQHHSEFSELLPGDDVSFCGRVRFVKGSAIANFPNCFLTVMIRFCGRVSGLSRTALSRIFRIASWRWCFVLRKSLRFVKDSITSNFQNCFPTMMFRFAEESQVCQGQHYPEFSELLPDDVSFCGRVSGLPRTALLRIFRIASWRWCLVLRKSLRFVKDSAIANFQNCFLTMMFRFAEESQVCQGQRCHEFPELLPGDDVSFCGRVSGLSRTALSRSFRIASWRWCFVLR